MPWRIGEDKGCGHDSLMRMGEDKGGNLYLRCQDCGTVFVVEGGIDREKKHDQEEEESDIIKELVNRVLSE